MKQHYCEANRKERNSPLTTTPQEKLVEKYLKSKKIEYEKERELFCGSKQYFGDFYLVKENLILEIDGSQHYSLKGRKMDRRKATMIMKHHGISIIHIKNSEVDAGDFSKINELKVDLIKNQYKVKPKKSKKVDYKKQYQLSKLYKANRNQEKVG